MTASVLVEQVAMPKGQPDSVTTRMATELMEAAHLICAHSKGTNNRHLKLSTLMDALVRPALLAVREEAIRRVREDNGEPLTLDEILGLSAQRMYQLYGGKAHRHRKSSD